MHHEVWFLLMQYLKLLFMKTCVCVPKLILFLSSSRNMYKAKIKYLQLLKQTYNPQNGGLVKSFLEHLSASALTGDRLA